MFEKEWNEYEWFFKGCAQITPFVLGGFGGWFLGEEMARYFKLNFQETLLCGMLSTLIGGLILGSVVWLVKYLSKKKLCVLFYYEKINEIKYKISFLLWNPMNLRDVRNEDYGENGLCLITNYGSIIKNFKAKMIDDTEELNYSTLLDKSGNKINLLMGDISIKSLIEIELYISKKTLQSRYPEKILPNGKRIKKYFTKIPFAKKPSIGFFYNHTDLNIRILKYNKIKYILNRIFSCMIIIISFLTVGVAILTFIYSFIVEAFIMLFLGLIINYIFIIILLCISDVIPPFVMKYLKTEAGAKYRKKRKIKSIIS